MTRRRKRSRSVLPDMIDCLIERLEELSEDDMDVEDIVRAYEALQRMDNILDTVTSNKRCSMVKSIDTTTTQEVRIIKRTKIDFW